MPITFSNLGASANPDINSSADLSSYSNSSWSPPTSGLILVFVRNRATTPGTPTISGNGLTWVQIATAVNGVSRSTLFAANAAGSSTGVTTIDFAGATQIACQASFFLADGVDLAGGVAAAFVQAPTNTGANVNNLSITLAAAANAANRPIAGFFHASVEATTERTNWTELDDFSVANGGGGLQTQYRSDAFETTASASWTSNVNADGIAAELKALLATADSILPELPIIDESYEEEHDYAGFIAWQTPESIEDVQILPELPIIDESFEEEHEYAGFTFWLLAVENIEDFQPLAELPIIDETYDEEHDYAGIQSWQMPSDVVEVQSFSEFAQIDETYDEALDHEYAGFISWQVPDNIQDFQALAELPQIDEHYDETNDHDFNGFVNWLSPDSVEDPLLGVAEFPQVDEGYELTAEFFGWQAVIITEPIVEEPPIAAELPQIELYYEPYFEYSGWQHVTIEPATEVLFGGVRLVGQSSDQVVGRGADQVVGVNKKRLRGLK